MWFRTRLDAMRVHLTQSFLLSLAGSLAWTAMMAYQVQIVGMTPLQLVLAGTAMELGILFFEVPTGIVADVYSRRLSAIIGYFIMGAAFALQGLVPQFEVILLGQALWGLGYTFTSGAYNAWLVDEVGVERSGQAFLRGAQVARVTGLVGIVVSTALGVIDLRVPIVAGGAVAMLSAAYLVLFMPENGFRPTPAPERTTWQKMGDTFRAGLAVVRARPALLSILAVGFFFGLFSEGWDRLWDAHLLLTFGLANAAVPFIVLRSALNISAQVLSVGVTEIVRRRLNTNHPPSVSRALFLGTLGMVIGIAAYGLAPSVGVAVVAFFVFVIARDQIEPLLNTWSNQHIPSPVRATVLSMQSQTDAIGQIAGGAPVGLVGNASLRAAFLFSGLLLAPNLFLLRRPSAEVETDDAAVEAGPVAGD